MDAHTWIRVQDLFAKAADLSAAERKAFLDRETAGDVALRTEVEGLLGHDRIHEAGEQQSKAIPDAIERIQNNRSKESQSNQHCGGDYPRGPCAPRCSLAFLCGSAARYGGYNLHKRPEVGLVRRR